MMTRCLGDEKATELFYKPVVLGIYYENLVSYYDVSVGVSFPLHQLRDLRYSLIVG